MAKLPAYFNKRAQVDVKKRFVEDLYNLKSSIADILRDDDKFLKQDIEKLQTDYDNLIIQDKAFKQLGIQNEIKKMLQLFDEDYESSIDKYKRFNNFYNKHIIKPLRQNIGLLGIEIPEATFEKDLGTEIVQPKTLKLAPIPEYLKLKTIPEVSKEPKSYNWHSKLDDVIEMLKVLGGYIPEFEEELKALDIIGTDTTQIISLEDNVKVNSNIVDASKFYALCGQIASRMKTAKLITVRADQVLYQLEVLPREFFLAPTQNREIVEILWNEYLRTGEDKAIATRVRQMSEERRELTKKFRRVYEQWVLLYDETAAQVGVQVSQPVQLQLVRYGKRIVSQRDITGEMADVVNSFEQHVENIRSLTSEFVAIHYRVQEDSGMKKVAQAEPKFQVGEMIKYESDKGYIVGEILEVEKARNNVYYYIEVIEPGWMAGDFEPKFLYKPGDKVYIPARFVRQFVSYHAPKTKFKVGQLRGPQAPVNPEEPGRLEIPEPERVIPEGEIKPVPPKLPVGEDFLPLVFQEDRDLYYSRNNKLTPPQAISMAGRNQLMIAMTYQKAQYTGDPEEMVVKNYVLEPYSYRMQRTQVRGTRKYFFGYDTVDNSIKKFLVGNIQAVQILPQKYSPRWEIEFY